MSRYVEQAANLDYRAKLLGGANLDMPTMRSL